MLCFCEAIMGKKHHIHLHFPSNYAQKCKTLYTCSWKKKHRIYVHFPSNYAKNVRQCIQLEMYQKEVEMNNISRCEFELSETELRTQHKTEQWHIKVREVPHNYRQYFHGNIHFKIGLNC